ncbi:MAG: hypothetical protein FWD84_01580 [Oscillospiraceae bacterium]|nr:hypothetical protein [Oscillospiraceae bacterium]
MFILVGCSANGVSYQEMQNTLQAEGFELTARLDRMGGDDVYKTFVLAEFNDPTTTAASRWVSFWFSIDDDSLVAITFSERDVVSGLVYLASIPYNQLEINDDARVLYDEFFHAFMYTEEDLIAFAKWYMEEHFPS